MFNMYYNAIKHKVTLIPFIPTSVGQTPIQCASYHNKLAQESPHKSASQTQDYKYSQMRNPYTRASSAAACPSPRTWSSEMRFGSTLDPSDIRGFTHKAHNK